jgi:L-glutamine-phosphate cytidylyltransferase
MRMIVLAAGAAKRLRPLTDDRPAALVQFNGRALLDWTMAAARENGITDIMVVGGYKSEKLARPDVQLIYNTEYSVTSAVGSMMMAETWFGEEFVVSYGNIVYRPEVLRAVLDSTAEIGVAVDLDWQPYWERRFGDPLREAESLRMTADGTIRSIGQDVNRLDDVHAQFIGLVVFRGKGVKTLHRAWIRAKTDASYRRPILGHRNALDKLAMTDVLDELTTGDVPVKAVPVHGGWVEVHTPEDISLAEERWNGTAAVPVVAPFAVSEPVAASLPSDSPDAGAGLGSAAGSAPEAPGSFAEVGIFRVNRTPRRW